MKKKKKERKTEVFLQKKRRKQAELKKKGKKATNLEVTSSNNYSLKCLDMWFVRWLTWYVVDPLLLRLFADYRYVSNDKSST